MSTHTRWDRARLAADAINRAMRSIIHGVLGELTVTFLPWLYREIEEGGAEVIVDWRSAARVALFATYSYLHRRFVDPSRVPSLLPPANPGQPVANPNGGNVS